MVKVYIYIYYLIMPMPVSTNNKISDKHEICRMAYALRTKIYNTIYNQRY